MIEQTEGTKVWLRVMNELKRRGTSDILIAVVDRLKLSRSYQCDIPADRGANLHRPSRSAFAGFCLGRTASPSPPQDHLPRHRRRSWPGRNGTFARRAMGYKIARSWRRKWNLSSRFCVCRSGPTHHLHHKRDRGAQFKIAPSGSSKRPLTKR